MGFLLDGVMKVRIYRQQLINTFTLFHLSLEFLFLLWSISLEVTVTLYRVYISKTKKVKKRVD